MKPRGRPKDSVPSGCEAGLIFSGPLSSNASRDHFEKAAGIVVDVDEGPLVDVEHHDHFGSMLHQGPVARLAFAHRLFGQMPLGDVADADDVAVAPVELALLTAISTATRLPPLARPQVRCAAKIHVGIVDLQGEALEKLGSVAGDLRQQETQRAAQDLRGGVAEDAFAGGIEGLDVAGVVHRDDGVLDVVEDGLQMRGRLLANLARQRLSFVGHELHRAHDAAPLAVDAVVVRTDGLEQRLEVQIAAPASGLRDLAFQEVVQAFRRLRGLVTMAAAISRDKSLISRTNPRVRNAPVGL